MSPSKRSENSNYNIESFILLREKVIARNRIGLLQFENVANQAN